MKTEPGASEALIRTAEKFAARHLAPAAAAVDHDAAFPAAVFAKGVEAGFDGLVLPGELGGTGFGWPDLCALLRTLARTCAGHAAVFGVHAGALAALRGTAFERSGALRDLVASGRPVGVALPEAAGPRKLDTGLRVVDADGGGLRVTGSAGLAVNADPSGSLIAFASRPDAPPAAVVLEGAAEGVRVGPPEAALGLRAMPIATVGAERHLVAGRSTIASGDEALELHGALLRHLSLVAAAIASGLLDEARRRAFAYAAERYQGGKLIIDHSHLRTLLGHIGAEATTAHGAVLHAASRPHDDLAVLGTKVVVTDHAVRACTDAVQLLGGYGYMRDYGLEKLMRDAATLALVPVSNTHAELMIAALEKVSAS